MVCVTIYHTIYSSDANCCGNLNLSDSLERIDKTWQWKDWCYTGWASGTASTAFVLLAENIKIPPATIIFILRKANTKWDPQYDAILHEIPEFLGRAGVLTAKVLTPRKWNDNYTLAQQSR